MSKMSPAEAAARLPATGTIRVYNQHPTRPFVYKYDSRWFIFQPKPGGRWVKVIEWSEGHGKGGHKRVPVHKLGEKKDGPKKVNWVEVPVSVAAKILQGDAAGLFRDDEKDLAGNPMGLDIYHHQGFLQVALQIEAELGSEFAETETALEKARAELAAVQAQIAEREAKLKPKPLPKE